MAVSHVIQKKNMVKNNISSPTKQFQQDKRLLLVEEKSSKPIGNPRFHRNSPQEIVVLSNNETINAATICQQMLTMGFVQSYVDFYYLTHRVDPNAFRTR